MSNGMWWLGWAGGDIGDEVSKGYGGVRGLEDMEADGREEKERESAAV